MDDEPAFTRFAGAQASLADVLDELFTLPFFSRRRLVVVEEADTFVTKYRKDLEAYVETPSSSAALLLQVKQWTSTTNLAKLVDKLGLAIECNALPEKQAAKVVSWLTQYARIAMRRRARPAAAANLLVELVGLEIGNPDVRGREAGRLRRRIETHRAGGRRTDGRRGPRRDGLEGPRRRHDRASRARHWSCSTTCWPPGKLQSCCSRR